VVRRHIYRQVTVVLTLHHPV